MAFNLENGYLKSFLIEDAWHFTEPLKQLCTKILSHWDLSLTQLLPKKQSSQEPYFSFCHWYSCESFISHLARPGCTAWMPEPFVVSHLETWTVPLVTLCERLGILLFCYTSHTFILPYCPYCHTACRVNEWNQGKLATARVAWTLTRPTVSPSCPWPSLGAPASETLFPALLYPGRPASQH